MIDNLIKSLNQTINIMNGRVQDKLDISGVKPAIYRKGGFYCPHCGERLRPESVVLCANCWGTITYKMQGELHDDGVEMLRDAILENAVHDYELAVHHKPFYHMDSMRPNERIESVRRFFQSDLYALMCPNLDGDVAIEMLEKEKGR